MKTQVLYRPVGLAELELIAASGWRAFPPRRVPAEELAGFNCHIVGNIVVVSGYR